MYGWALMQAEKYARERHVQNCARKCFVKVSGDLFRTDTFLEWIKELSIKNRVVISIGGGTQINVAFAEKDIAFEKHPTLGRNTTSEGYQLAGRVLEKNKSWLIWQLKLRSVIADVVFPAINLAGEVCHVDGDIMVYSAYWGFDELYVVTTPDRVEAKQKLFEDMPKVTVITM